MMALCERWPQCELQHFGLSAAFPVVGRANRKGGISIIESRNEEGVNLEFSDMLCQAIPVRTNSM